MDVSEIRYGESFEAWLQDKPNEWAQVLAARIALRVAPLAFSVAALPNDVLEKKHRESLTLLTFRANFISSAPSKYPTDDMRRAALAAADAALAAARAALAADAATNAANAAHAAARAAYAAAYTADAAHAAADAAVAAAVAADAATIWGAIRADCAWLEFNDNRYPDDSFPSYSLGNKHKTLAAELSRHSLWVDGFDERGKTKAADMPEYILENFNVFSNSELAQTTSFGFIVDWYMGLNTYSGRAYQRNILTKEAEIKIAKMSPAEWGDGDKERDCIAVMDRVAEIAGWGRKSDERYIWDEKTVPKTRPASVIPKWQGTILYNDTSPLVSELREQQGVLELLSLRDEMQSLSLSVAKEGNVDKRPADYLEETAMLITDKMPDAKTLFSLMRREQVLMGFRKDVDAQWPDFLASRYGTMADEFTIALDQFLERREFDRAKTEISLKEIDATDANKDVANSIAVMRTEFGKSRIDESLPATVEDISNTKNSTENDNAELKKVQTVDELESLNNIMKQLALRSNNDSDAAELLRQLNEQYNEGMREGIIEGAREAGKNDGKRIGKTVTRTAKSAQVGSAGKNWLSKKYPKLFGWLDKR